MKTYEITITDKNQSTKYTIDAHDAPVALMELWNKISYYNTDFFLVSVRCINPDRNKND